MTEADRIDTLSGFSRIIRIIEEMPDDDVPVEIGEAFLKIYLAAMLARYSIRDEESAT